MRPYPAPRRLLAREEGFTLIEVLIVSSLLAVVLGALMYPIALGERTQKRDANYAYAQQRARTGLDSMVSQIRQATSILSSGPNYVELNVTLSGTALLVDYQCDVPQSGTQYHECVRVQTAAGSQLPSVSSSSPVVIKNVVNGTTPVFSWGPDPSAPYYMTATIGVPASGGSTGLGGLYHTIWFSSGALMRNLNVAN
jgi:prepilin-type N-terminal cleavage/methylation domain-containing protein